MRLNHMKRMLIGAIAGAVAVVSTASAAPRRVQVTLGGMSVTPPQLSVNVGDTVEWLNQDVVDHTTTEKKGALWNVSIAPGKSAKVVMKKAGRFDYYCRYHPNMVATLIVGGARK